MGQDGAREALTGVHFFVHTVALVFNFYVPGFHREETDFVLRSHRRPDPNLVLAAISLRAIVSAREAADDRGNVHSRWFDRTRSGNHGVESGWDQAFIRTAR